MIHNQLQNIEQLESSLWEAADQLRANSKLASGEYFMPVLGIIFLRHATNRYEAARRQIAEEQGAGKMPKRPLVKQDFLKRRALMLPKEARFDELLKLPKETNLGAALVEAMNAIERDFEPLLNQLPKDYDKFESNLLEEILRIFDSDALRTASGDVFGRIVNEAIQTQEEGKEIGVKEGRKDGAESKAKEMAKMLKENGVDIDLIAKSSGLTREEIEKL